MNSLFERFIAAILSLFLITYAGYQAYRYIYTKYKTETTYSYTIADTIKTHGVIIRDELVINEMPSGIVDYLYDDGTKISADEPIAEVYSSESDVRKQKRIRAIDEEIKMLESAQNQALTQTTHADVLNRQISEQLGSLVDISSAEKIDNLDISSKQLSLLINKKQIAIGKIGNLNSRITSLQNQKDYYTNGVTSNYQTFNSPSTGYFVRDIDGMEDVINTNNMLETSIDEYKKLIYTESTTDNSTIGKIVLDHNWYLAISANKETAAKFPMNVKVDLDFGINNLSKVPAVVDEIISNEAGTENIILIKCNYILPELVSMRNTDVVINFKSYTGLKVSTAAIRFKDNQKGVYIKQGHEIRFKTVEPIYEELGFVLCANSSEQPNALRLFDEVIVEGTELYDGKGIK